MRGSGWTLSNNGLELPQSLEAFKKLWSFKVKRHILDPYELQSPTLQFIPVFSPFVTATGLVQSTHLRVHGAG